jgi:hypothetical protein
VQVIDEEQERPRRSGDLRVHDRHSGQRHGQQHSSGGSHDASLDAAATGMAVSGCPLNQ